MTAVLDPFDCPAFIHSIDNDFCVCVDLWLAELAHDQRPFNDPWEGDWDDDD